ncbi:DUF397 domain-containing protein [Nocardia sp. IFM 10818]
MSTNPDFGTAQWRKSALSQDGSACVEVAFVGAVVALRDSKYRRDPQNRIDEQPVICLPADQWQTFLAAVTEGSFSPAEVRIQLHDDGSATVSDQFGVQLSYTVEEWNAFIAAIKSNGFVAV